MTLELRYAVLAEAALVDPRGNPTLVGLDPAWWTVPVFPAMIAPTFCMSVARGSSDDSPLYPGGPLTLSTRIQVTGPDGEVLFFTEVNQVAPPPPPLGPEPKVSVVLATPFTVAKTGDYTISGRLGVPTDGSSVEVARMLRVYDDASVRDLIERGRSDS